MPRRMPSLSSEFNKRVVDALGISEAGEVAASRDAGAPLRFTLSRLEALYEMAFLRTFVGWEAFLEQAFIRYLAGYISHAGQQRLPAGRTYSPTLNAAEAQVLGGKAYRLWHNPQDVTGRCRQFFLAGESFETVVASNSARIGAMAAVRHRIAHAQEDAAKKFDVATLLFNGRQYRGARPGRFLRDWVPAKSPPTRWLHELSTELIQLARQIA